MINVVLFGTGNLATHLAKAFSTAPEVNVLAIWGRKTPDKARFGAIPIRTNSLAKIPMADLYMLCVSDDAIANLSQQLPLDALVVHCSGALTLDSLSQVRRGTFWPIQTFSKNQSVSLNKVPICIEAAIKNDLALLKNLVTSIGAKSISIDAKQRATLHLAAVFVNNFVNQLYSTAHSMLEEQQLPYELLEQLILETAKKGIVGDPKDHQTGPAKRSDKNVMKSHKSLLNSEQKQLYVTLSKSIHNTHNNNELQN